MILKWISRFLSNGGKMGTAFSFFRLRSEDITYFQYVFPTVLTLVTLVLYELIQGDYFVVNLDSFVASATTLMGVLIGFYIAALAAVTSFPNESLNSIMSGRAPKIRERTAENLEEITRRRFLSILLGYCAFLSIFIYGVGSVAAAIEVSTDVSPLARSFMTSLWWFIYTWLLASLLTVTMLCLHYLIDRMHRD